MNLVLSRIAFKKRKRSVRRRIRNRGKNLPAIRGLLRRSVALSVLRGGLPEGRKLLVERRLTYTLLDVKRGISAVIAMLVLIAPSAAWAGKAFDEVLKDYRGDANIDPCKHSEKTLSDAAGQVPNDIEQYAPDFPEALGNAIAARARGACEGKAFRRVFKDYQRDGEISPCRHTLRELLVALRQTPDDIKQTAPGFPGEVRRSIKERRHDRCGHK